MKRRSSRKNGMFNVKLQQRLSSSLSCGTLETVTCKASRGMIPTIRDVARRARVSETTVSLAFREGSRISPATRGLVLKIARQLRYVPNRSAKALRDGQTRTIGFLVADITNPFYTLMISRAETVALRRGYQIFVVDSKGDADKELSGVRSMIQSRVQGTLVCLCEKTDGSGDLIEASRTPAIALDTYPRGYTGAFVENDIPAAGRLAANQLLDVGCRRPVFLTAEEDMARFSGFVKLQAGFAQALRDRGIEFGSRHIIHSGMVTAAGVSAFDEIRRTVPDADGIFCPNDLCALGVIEAADRARVRVPRDLAVMGIDDIPIASMSRLSLTSIRQPHERIAELATKALIDSIEAGTPPQIRETLAPELMVRGSTSRKASMTRSQ
jgi:LacI family transcriptional regulator